MRPDDSDLVWSSEQGDLRKQVSERGGKRGGTRPKRKHATSQSRVATGARVKVRREVSGRRGKTVTTVSGIPLGDAGVRKLSGRLKKSCGVGGTVRNGVIELQGDHREKVIGLLADEGFTAVAAGG